MHTNAIYCGDCRNVLGNTLEFPDNSVDLVYVDPPFFSNRKYEVLWGDGYELRAFEDRWKSGGIENYLSWMQEKIGQCHRVLKPNGSFYLHCDSSANYRLRQLAESVFGDSHFRNEIVWRRSFSHNDPKRFGANHDTILFFTKGDTWTWNPLYSPIRDVYVDRDYRFAEGPDGTIITLKKRKDGTREPPPPGWKRFREDNLTASKPGGDVSYEWKGVRPYKGRYWAFSKENMEKFDREGRLIYRKTGMPVFKRYLSDSRGVPLQTFWDDISPIISGSPEAEGFPTQKPLALLERIIRASSNPGDVVLDPMCGCGTTIVAAQKLGRSWVGIDVSPTACGLMATRVAKVGAHGVEIVGLPKTINELMRVEPFEFQNWVIQRLMGRVSARKTGDMGIDGYLFDGSPVQVKQSEDVGRNVVDNFETAIRRAKKSKGMIIALSFGKGAIEEAARAKNEAGLEITLKTLEELVEEE
ncbi:MAG: restriction endonuclease [Candidatus Thermoplasmatota archaeon]|nr:restriction endonuclease [Candidatus Thermoplasmatota archaeon]